MPLVQADEAQPQVQLLAESLKINSEKTVDGSQALTKEDGSWNIWGGEE